MHSDSSPIPRQNKQNREFIHSYPSHVDDRALPTTLPHFPFQPLQAPSSTYHNCLAPATMSAPNPEDVAIEDVDTSSGKGLLDLPAELRNVIYEMVLVSQDMVRLTSEDHTAPGLLRVNEQIRAESRAIYYCQNRFLIKCKDFDSTALLAFRQQSKDILPTMGKLEYPKTKPVISVSSLRVPHPRNRANLLRWAKAVHAGLLAVKLSPRGDPGRKAGRIVLTLAHELRDLPWARVIRTIKMAVRHLDVPWT